MRSGEEIPGLGPSLQRDRDIGCMSNHMCVRAINLQRIPDCIVTNTYHM